MPEAVLSNCRDRAMKKINQPVHADYSHHPILGRLYPEFLRQARRFVGLVGVDIAMQLLRQAWLEEAATKVAHEHGRVIYSRVALLAGGSTRCIPELQTKALFTQQTPLTSAARIIHVWANDAAYHEPQKGQPAVLLIHGCGVTFERLVTSAAGRGITPQTVLEVLMSAGLVRIENGHWVRLISTDWQAINQA